MDRITLDILWNRLIAAVNEQAATLIRSSFTSIVREAGDLSAGVFDRQGRMVAQAVTGTPGHINSLATGMVHFLERFPIDSLVPGDVLITNDPWKTASQLNDLSVVTPVFREKRVVALFASCCHALDIGGRGLSADSRSVFEEGMFIPVMKLHDAGRPVTALFDLLAANVRTPEEVLGDLHSQIVGNEVGGRQLLALLDEFGLADIEELSEQILQRSEAGMRQRIAELPDGTHSFELWLDGFDDPIQLCAAVTIDGDSISVDFAGTSGPVPQGVNVCYNYTAAYTNYAVKCAISPDIPNNHGSFQPVALTVPESCILNAQYPVAVGGRHLVGHFVPSLIMGALHATVPERVMAPGFDGLWDTHLAGRSKESDQYFSYTWFSAGGTGALSSKDGLSASAYPSAIAGVPVEVIESAAPIVVRCRELTQDSGGAGQFRGGLGQTMEFEVLTDQPYLFSGLYERTRFAPVGLAGGEDAPVGRAITNSGSSIQPKIRQFFEPDVVVRIDLPGGGGYGPPTERDPETVLADVRSGYVSAAAAETLYRVRVDTDRWVVDSAATAQLRKTPSA